MSAGAGAATAQNAFFLWIAREIQQGFGMGDALGMVMNRLCIYKMLVVTLANVR